MGRAWGEDKALARAQHHAPPGGTLRLPSLGLQLGSQGDTDPPGDKGLTPGLPVPLCPPGKAEHAHQGSRGHPQVGAAHPCHLPHQPAPSMPLKKIWSEKSENRAYFPPISPLLKILYIVSQSIAGGTQGWRDREALCP